MSKGLRTTARITFLAVVAGTLLFLVSECNKPDPRACAFGLRAAEMFHQGFNDPKALSFSSDPLDRDLEDVRTTSGSFMFGGWLSAPYVQDARSRLGRFESASVKNCEKSYGKVGTFIRLTFESQFERGAATEKITFLVNPGDDPDSASMTTYAIESPLFPRPPTF